MSRNKKGECPVCKKVKKNVGMHLKIEHPDYKPDDVQPTEPKSEVTPVEQTDVQPNTPLPTPEPTVIPEQATPIKVKRIWNISWWKVILGAICLLVGIIGVMIYVGSMNMFAGVLAVIGLTPGAFLVYYGFKNKKESGYQFASGKKGQHTGKENTIFIKAEWDSERQAAIPVNIDFVETPDNKIPAGAHPHLLRNNGKHYYVIYNPIDAKTGKEFPNKAVIMPDKKLITPEAFVIPSNMQAFKEYMQFNPPSAFQKIASGILILAMIIVGLLMLVTTSKTPAEKTMVKPIAMEIFDDTLR